MTTALMRCGCAGSARHNNAHDGLEAGHPSCVVHIPAKAACEPREAPSLEGRFAKCGEGCAIVPSSVELAFFEYRGPDSPAALQDCGECGYYESAHKEGRVRSRECAGFQPHGPYEYDHYYCGHSGWD